MVDKIVKYIHFLKSIDIFQFFYLNYFCKSVIRIDESKIIPYKNAVIDIASSSKIYLGEGDIEIGCDLLRRSKSETKVRMREQAIWISTGGCKISYGSTLEILQNAVLDCKYFTMNSNSTLIAAKRITLGQDVMIGRNVIIYDSDYHQIVNENGKIVNPSQPVTIDNHVLLATNVMVLKGVTIGAGSIIGANVIVNRSISENMILNVEYKLRQRENTGRWDRKKPSL